MNKIYILLLVVLVFSCQQERKKVAKTKAHSSSPIIIVEGKSVPIDSLLLVRFNSSVLKAFYLESGFKSVWQSQKDRNNILKQLSNSDEEGLNPENYAINKLQNFEEKYSILSIKEKANYDVLLTHNLQKYISHLTNGQFNPNNFYKDWDLKRNTIDINATLAQWLKSDSLQYKIAVVKPDHSVYKSLKKALKIINSFPIDDCKPIEINTKIVLNDTNPALMDIKKRLIYWKDMLPKDSLSNIYDDEANAAVIKFQVRHGLLADGVLGKGTIKALNVSKKLRKAQILANLERWKWFPKDMGSEYLIVNIPDFKVTVVKNGDTVQTHKVIVGRDKRPTPIVSSQLTNVVLNPTWTVPPTILREDVIPAISKNRNYLAQTNIKVFDSKGNEVSASSWKLSNATGYRYVQSPGTFNSLGMVKLIFPNRFSVYLHDTNHRDFFGKQNRSLSSGCVRVQNPLELAEYLLDNKTEWNIEKITQILQSDKTRSIKIKNNVQIHILYWTAWSEKNKLIFRDDIYNLDNALYQKLRK